MAAFPAAPPWKRAPHKNGLTGNQLTDSAGTAYNHHLRKAHEQPVFHDPGAARELICELRWIRNRAEITVKDHIALVGSILFSLWGVPDHILRPQLLEIAGSRAPAER